MASTQNPQERQLKTALLRTPPPLVPAKLTKPQTKPSATKPSAVMTQSAATPIAHKTDSFHPPATHSQITHSQTTHVLANRAPDQKFNGDVNADALKLQRLKEGQAMFATPVYKRALWLTSDAIVLTIASPFFAVWWIARTIKRLTEPK